MKYFLDIEFLEGTQRLRKTFLEALFATKIYTEPTIDLISIGIICEDGREYYAISKDFNLKEAWNRYDIKSMSGKGGIGENTHDKIYWIRENVLKPIWKELIEKERSYYMEMFKRINVWTKYIDDDYYKFTYKEFKRLIKKYGKTNKQIAKEIIKFIDERKVGNTIISPAEPNDNSVHTKNVKFYGYYCDYDWVVFCWLFGKMNDLPEGFPYYCIDLKQTLDEFQDLENNSYQHELNCNGMTTNPLKIIKDLPNYPLQINEHNALADAHWNYELYKFLNTL